MILKILILKNRKNEKVNKEENEKVSKKMKKILKKKRICTIW